MMNGGAAQPAGHQETGRGRSLSRPTVPPAISTAAAKRHGKNKSLQVVVTQHSFPNDAVAEDGIDEDEDPDAAGVNDTVGTLLADIARAISDALQMLMFADKRHWTSDEFEQVRALEDALDEAKADFQELGPLLKGSFYYENDRRPQSLDELRILRMQWSMHGQTFKDWLRQGGPINALWTRDTVALRRDLHRAQRRAAARIFASQQADIAGGGSGHRCLGAFEVYRRQRRLEDRRKEYRLGRRPSRYESTRDEVAENLKRKGRTPSWKQQAPTMDSLGSGESMEMGVIDTKTSHYHQDSQDQQQQQYSQRPMAGEGEASTTARLEELVPACNAVGRFERFGDQDVAFSCDFCDGFLVWPDLAAMPSELDPDPAASGVTEQPAWQARGKSLSRGEDKTVVFAPLAIANHISPDPGDWQARILCAYCDEYDYYEAGDEGETRYAQDERGFATLQEFQEHLEWYHTSVAVPSLQTAAKNCVVM